MKNRGNNFSFFFSFLVPSILENGNNYVNFVLIFWSTNWLYEMKYSASADVVEFISFI